MDVTAPTRADNPIRRFLRECLARRADIQADEQIRLWLRDCLTTNIKRHIKLVEVPDHVRATSVCSQELWLNEDGLPESDPHNKRADASDSTVFPYVCRVHESDALFYIIHFYRRAVDEVCTLLSHSIALESLQLQTVHEMDRIIKACPDTLTSLKIRGGSCVDVTHLPPSLKALRLRTHLLDHDAIGKICARCPDLEHLDFFPSDSKTHVKVNGISCLQLTRLILGGCRLSGTMPSLPDLKELHIENCVFVSPRVFDSSDVFWRLLKATPNLERLRVEHTPIGYLRDHRGMNCGEFPPNLNYLSVVNPAVDSWNLSDLRGHLHRWRRSMNCVKIVVGCRSSTREDDTVRFNLIRMFDVTCDIETHGGLLSMELRRNSGGS